MAKKKKPRPSSQRPPDGFWLSQQGDVVPVRIHAETLQEMPDIFGLEKAPWGKDEINEAMSKVISDGWIRGRRVEDSLQFQVWTADSETVRVICDFLHGCHEGVVSIMIETVEPRGYWSFTFDEWMSKCYPTSWRLGSSDG